MRSRSTYIIVCCLLQLLSTWSRGQSKEKIDSLEKLAFVEQVDSQRVKLYNKLADAHRYTDPNKTKDYARKAIQLGRSSNFPKGVADGYNLLAQGHEQQGFFPQALSYYDSSLVMWKKAGSKTGEAKILLNIANVYQKTADYATAADYCLRSLQVQEEMNNAFGMAVCKLTLGNILYGQGERKTALGHYIGALELNRKSEKNEMFEASALANIGAIFNDQELYDSALVFHRRAYSLLTKIGADAKVASSLNNIASTLASLGYPDSALIYARKAYALNMKLSRPEGLVTTMRGLGNLFSDMGQLDSALWYYQKSLALSKRAGLKEAVLSGYWELAGLFEKKKMADSALKYLRLHNDLNDSLHGESQLLQLEQMKQNYEFNKQEQAQQLLRTQSELEAAALRNKIMLLIIGVLAISLLAFLLFLRFKNKQKLAEVLERKNEEITQQKEEITDSINYAKRIQESILPPRHAVKKLLPDSFILYMPKDIVSGDFYWVEERGTKIHFAAVDCTGHGVPGALMSVVGFNMLNQAVHEAGFSKPSDILQHLDYGVNKLLRQSTEENTVKDGMDLALCSIDKNSGKVEYAGAMNPVYVVRNGAVIQYKADKFPIGINVDGITDTYTNHVVDTQKGDMLYLFSDGYTDQFGGPKGKKFKPQQFRELLCTIAHFPCDIQEIKLREAFENWRGTLEQVDDVCVIGVRIQ